MDLKDRLDSVLQIMKDAAGRPPSGQRRCLLLVYPPDDEHDLRKRLEQFISSLALNEMPSEVFDLALLPFEILDERGLLDKAFALEVKDPQAFRTDMAGRLEPRLIEEISRRSEALGEGLLILSRPAALFPWISFSNVLKQLPSGLPSHILLPFPGTESSASLHFLGRRNGFDYLARRV